MISTVFASCISLISLNRASNSRIFSAIAAFSFSCLILAAASSWSSFVTSSFSGAGARTDISFMSSTVFASCISLISLISLNRASNSRIFSAIAAFSFSCCIFTTFITSIGLSLPLHATKGSPSSTLPS